MIIKTLLEPNKYSLWLAILWSTLILVLSFKAPSVNPKYVFPHEDKVVHFTFYFVFVILWYRYFFYKNWSTLKHFISLLLIAILMGILIELAQGFFTANRQADVYDALANTLGSSVGLVLIRFLYSKSVF